MKRNCYLDLRLRSSSAYSPSHHSMNETLNIRNKLVAILHNGRHCTFDMTELQARVIIWMASREMEERNGGAVQTSWLSLQPKALSIYAPRGLSMKRSLQNFLQKRKKRSQTHISIVTHRHSGVN